MREKETSVHGLEIRRDASPTVHDGIALEFTETEKRQEDQNIRQETTLYSECSRPRSSAVPIQDTAFYSYACVKTSRNGKEECLSHSEEPAGKSGSAYPMAPESKAGPKSDDSAYSSTIQDRAARQQPISEFEQLYSKLETGTSQQMANNGLGSNEKENTSLNMITSQLARDGVAYDPVESPQHLTADKTFDYKSLPFEEQLYSRSNFLNY